ncbi:MAG: RHS repeat-associated core domain-containing protein [Actinobacteria bacterium]|nr:RHS repeat-associated core domain-containing protein [Actinomycetota bacterium]
MKMTCMTPANTSGVTCGDPNPSVPTAYVYNGGELKTEEVPPGRPVQYFTYNMQSSVPQLLMDGSNVYIYRPQGNSLGNGPVEQISLSAPNSQSSVTYLYSDPEGVRFTFNSSGNLTGEATYNAYGNVTSGGISSITPFSYAGGYTDPTGLIYLIHRYYDPVTGQFTSVDPLVGISGQPYVYAEGDPVNGSDPLGLGCDWSYLGTCVSDVWHPVRTVLTYPVTVTTVAIDYGYSLLPGRNVSCQWNSANLVFVCSGGPTILNAPATTFGAAINTQYSYCDFLAANNGGLIKHETKHTDQWAIFGPAFPGLDIVASIYAEIRGGQQYNPFEIWAGLKNEGCQPLTNKCTRNPIREF